MQTYPIKLTYHVRSYYFGERLIPELLGKRDAPAGVVAETWDISDCREARATVTNGPYAGRTLHDLVVEFPEELVGKGWSGPHFPLLEKFLDASYRLPVHLHADDETAREKHGEPRRLLRAGSGVGVHDVEVGPVVSGGENFVQVVVDYPLPGRLPVADLVVARPVGVRGSEPRRCSCVGPTVPVRVPATLPIPTIVLGLADAHVGEDALGAGGAVFQGPDLARGEPALVGAVAGVVDDDEVELRLPDVPEVDVL